MAIQLYNTMTRRKEEFIPMEPGKVRMYVCGPTVYNYFHIGNARCFVVFDAIRRYLEYRGFSVEYIQNFTDVDDKIIRTANETGMSPLEVANRFIASYFEDADKLGVKRATAHPRVTENMNEIIKMIEELISKGHAYVVDGDVYYATETFQEYGKLSKQSIEDLQSGARIEVSEKKRNPLDFALWKAAKPGEIAWDSPWGKGRPGWHIECSAMSRKYLGVTFDIHAGGHDLIFPHHENEIAQSEGANEAPFARYWLHNGFVNIRNEKMSKSAGNFLTVRDLVNQYDPSVLRFFLLSAHYRNPLNFSEELLQQAEQGLQRIQTCYEKLTYWLDRATADDPDTVVVEGYRERFEEAMDDDFNTADAISVIFDLVRDANTKMDAEHPHRAFVEAYHSLLVTFMDVLGFPLAKKDVSLDEEIERLIAERNEARKKKDWTRADRIRDQLAEMGILLEDTPQGVRWKRK
ncbi:cysteine--tRNA ligase [Collibacillus ludicampi]|jgi:cysteinyl-tRNA synthetase|uniref:Cysteine--tRNA ligase n=1 Tax=Collibacillus ludicampi TaxID=2771369 RepID=A0AAV4LEJ5_9BACL|nr:cysteine--tRNA ligase [Collibacillus ludicampi]GIM46098.1 cysteine--tRNA ligase [Collibacillus ludicampi]